MGLMEFSQPAVGNKFWTCSVSCQRLPLSKFTYSLTEVDQAALLEPANSQEVAVWKWGIPVQILRVLEIYVLLDN